ncbi:hypothetical protein ANA_C13482 [Anabaena sp. 90]|uniref:hypothetical protein n=1 Tax=Anabaena sp. 90 TaxID=46234 RepID=UPI00029B61FF|nr:hypothetical protein [Anabaena sp. 90]AFW96144.1 hypothetical protein ANA_C13482 [Anabaena sp. 90]
MTHTFIYGEEYSHLNEFSGKIPHSDISTWTGTLGIPDKSSLKVVQISLYLDGHLEQNTNILRGNFAHFKIDVKSHRTYSWKYKILQGRCNYLYVLRWGFQ